MFLLVPAHPDSPGQRAVKRSLLLLYLFGFSILCVFFWFSSDYFVLVLFASVALDLVFFVSSILRQELGWDERLRNDLFCVSGT